MKILYIIHSCIMGGATISFKNLVKGIRQKGIEAVVVHPKPEQKDERLISELKNIGCSCVQLNVAVSYNMFGRNILKYILRFAKLYRNKRTFYRQLYSVVLQEQPDIIHTNTGVVHEGFLVAQKLNIPHVWHLREYQTKDFHMKVIPSLKKFKSMLTKSYTVCITKDIQDYFGLSKNALSKVIYNPAMSKNEIFEYGTSSLLNCMPQEASVFEDCNSCAHERTVQEASFCKKTRIEIAAEISRQFSSFDYFLVANRISPEKGIDAVLDAFAEFCEERDSFLLKIAGFGNERHIHELKQKCLKLGISGNVEFLGFVSDVRPVMQKARALIVGSYNEGFGRMTAEANMLGIPVIGRNSGGTKEILELTGGGILFNTTEEMKEAMVTIAATDDEQKRNGMKRPQEKAVELFSNEQHIKNVLELYTNIFGTVCHIMGGGKDAAHFVGIRNIGISISSVAA